jgi:hypothetical protein
MPVLSADDCAALGTADGGKGDEADVGLGLSFFFRGPIANGGE